MQQSFHFQKITGTLKTYTCFETKKFEITICLIFYIYIFILAKGRPQHLIVMEFTITITKYSEHSIVIWHSSRGIGQKFTIIFGPGPVKVVGTGL